MNTQDSERRVSPLQPGVVVAGRYEVVQCLGVGSLGTVYLCRSVNDHNNLVALKELAPTQTSGPGGQISLARFRNEIATLLRIRHPHVVQIFAYVSEPNLTAYLMDFVAGGDLASYMRNHPPFTIPEIVRLMRQICQGVNAIWQAGIVHRDLKPSNILLTETFDVKIADFGIARSEDGPRLTARGGVVGTIEYLSPQYLEDGAIGPLGDVYAIGVIAYELITGRTPYAGFGLLKTVEIKVTSDPVPPESRNPECPDWLSKIALRAMARDASKRFSSAIEIDRALAAGESTFDAADLSQAHSATIVPFRHSASKALHAPALANMPTHDSKLGSASVEGPQIADNRPMIIPIGELAAEYYSTGTVKVHPPGKRTGSAAIDHHSIVPQPPQARALSSKRARYMHLARLGGGGFALGIILLLAFTPGAWRERPATISSTVEIASLVPGAEEVSDPSREFSLVSNSDNLTTDSANRDLVYARLGEEHQTFESNSALLEPIPVEGSLATDRTPKLQRQPLQRLPVPNTFGLTADAAKENKTPKAKVPVRKSEKLNDVGRRVTSAVASIPTTLERNSQQLPETTESSQALKQPIAPPPVVHDRSTLLISYERPPSDVEEPSTEFKIRATLLYRMADYVQWPADAFTSQQDSLRICIIGRDPFGVYLDTLLSKAHSRSGHKFAVHRLAVETPSSVLAACQVVYLNRVPASRAERSLAGLRNRSTLVISENTGSGAIDFVMRDGKVKFTVDSERAAAAGLTIGSVLLDLAVPKEE